MRADDTQNCVPQVPAGQSTLDQTRKYLRKLRWIGMELEARTILEALHETRLQPPLPGYRRKISLLDSVQGGSPYSRDHRCCLTAEATPSTSKN